MADSLCFNDQFPTDPTTMLAVTVLASLLLARALTPEEATAFQTVFPALLGAIPFLRR